MRLARILLTNAKTGITGLAAVPNPRPVLIEVYKSTLSALNDLPAHSVYRQATSALTKQRLEIVEKNEDTSAIENLIGQGLIEEVIKAAESELSLVARMNEWKP